MIIKETVRVQDITNLFIQMRDQLFQFFSFLFHDLVPIFQIRFLVGEQIDGNFTLVALDGFRFWKSLTRAFPQVEE